MHIPSMCIRSVQYIPSTFLSCISFACCLASNASACDTDVVPTELPKDLFGICCRRASELADNVEDGLKPNTAMLLRNARMQTKSSIAHTRT